MQEIYSESPSDIQFPFECGQHPNLYMILSFEICIEVSIQNAYNVNRKFTYYSS